MSESLWSRTRIALPKAPFVAAAIALAVVDGAARTLYLGTLAIPVFATGFCLLTLGARRTRMLAVPLFLLLFLLPLPSNFGDELGMRHATAVVGEWIVRVLDIPAFREGNALILPGDPNIVTAISDNCSGFSALYAGGALAIALAASTSSLWRRVLLILALYPAAVVFNGLRVALLVGLTHWVGPQMVHTVVHTLSGIVTFWAVIATLLLLADWASLREALR